MSRRRRPSSPALSEEEQRLFREAVADVTPLETEPRPSAPPPPPPRRLADRDTGATAPGEGNPADATGHGSGPGLTDGSGLPRAGDEVLSFRRGGIQHKVMRRLANGQMAITAELDLHGLTRDTARAELTRFMAAARQRQQCCVRIIHGKGGAEGSVLKGLVDAWLQQRPEVLAFASAPANAGGTGALLVLLART